MRVYFRSFDLLMFVGKSLFLPPVYVFMGPYLNPPAAWRCSMQSRLVGWDPPTTVAPYPLPYSSCLIRLLMRCFRSFPAGLRLSQHFRVPPPCFPCPPSRSSAPPVHQNHAAPRFSSPDRHQTFFGPTPSPPFSPRFLSKSRFLRLLTVPDSHTLTKLGCGFRIFDMTPPEGVVACYSILRCVRSKVGDLPPPVKLNCSFFQTGPFVNLYCACFPSPDCYHSPKIISPPVLTRFLTALLGSFSLDDSSPPLPSNAEFLRLHSLFVTFFKNPPDDFCMLLLASVDVFV